MNTSELQKILAAWKKCCDATNTLYSLTDEKIDEYGDILILCCEQFNTNAETIIDLLECWASGYSATYTNFLCQLQDNEDVVYEITFSNYLCELADVTTTTTTCAATTTTSTTTVSPTLVEWEIGFENYLCAMVDNPFVTTLPPPPPNPVFAGLYTNFVCAMENNPAITTTTTTQGITTSTTTNPLATTTTSTTISPTDIGFSATYDNFLCAMVDNPLLTTTTTTTITEIDEDDFSFSIVFEDYLCIMADVTTTTTTLVTTTTTTAAATTTTTMPVTTTTTTVSVNCGSLITGTQEYNVAHHINVGGGIGTEVVMTINTVSIPDKFIVYHAGEEVINTGYRGDTDYQDILYTELAVLGEPEEIILDKSVTRFTFIKTSADPIATVYIYAPIKETEWSFVVSCPIVTTTTTTAGEVFIGEYTNFVCAMIEDGSPTTTTTTAPVTTTTTTQAEIPVETVTCGETWHSGGNVYPYLYVVIGLGTGVGWVELSISTVDVPDKFIVEFNGLEVINTGYRGNLALQNELNIALASYGDSPEAIQDPETYKFYFYKAGTTQNAVVKVYAPMEESTWEFRLRCPDGVTTTTTTRAITTTTTTAAITTTTTTVPVTTTTTTNALPVSADNAVSNTRESCSQSVSLVPADFTYADTEGDALEYVQIESYTLAGAGTLKYDGKDVTPNKKIRVYGGATGSFLYSLIYTPDASLEDAYSDTIVFSVRTAGNEIYG